MTLLGLCAAMFLGFASLSPVVSPQNPEFLVLTAKVLDVASGQSYDCEDLTVLSLEGLRLCATHSPLIILHEHGQLGSEHTPNSWTITQNNPDGTVRKGCGEWHAEPDYTNNICERVFAGGASKTVASITFYRCTTSDCDSGHWTTGLVKSLEGLPSTFEFWGTYENGVLKPAEDCYGTYGTGDQSPKIIGYIQQDTSPWEYCGTSISKGSWGASADYWP